jgi:hypothetical protein
MGALPCAADPESPVIAVRATGDGKTGR